MLSKLRVQNKRHQKPSSRPEALQENPAEACFWNSQDKTSKSCEFSDPCSLPPPCRALYFCIPPLFMAP